MTIETKANTIETSPHLWAAFFCSIYTVFLSPASQNMRFLIYPFPREGDKTKMTRPQRTVTDETTVTTRVFFLSLLYG